MSQFCKYQIYDLYETSITLAAFCLCLFVLKVFLKLVIVSVIVWYICVSRDGNDRPNEITDHQLSSGFRFSKQSCKYQRRVIYCGIVKQATIEATVQVVSALIDIYRHLQTSRGDSA